LLLLYGLSTLVSQLFTIVLARYRLALVPVLIIYGAVVLVRLFDALRLRQWRMGLACTTLIAAVAVLQHLICPIPELRTDLSTAHHYLEYFYSAKLYAGRKQFDRAIAEAVRMRQRATAVPDTTENRQPKVITMSVALEREGYLRVLLANQLFERGQNEQARLMADLAKSAYLESIRMTNDFLGKPLNHDLENNVEDTRLFFESVLPVREKEGRGDGPAVRTLLGWLGQ